MVPFFLYELRHELPYLHANKWSSWLLTRYFMQIIITLA
ncbi:hypothetical protein GPLA_3539 [Paraglaciecola polaris LMG 21857]|uniref:Uncharacterized protein n=1 Tax=Paraglaciecola polaris LMG 21857 TaxID=1129793 RepID=K6ZW03_9ALTE|nr:hypothetical protein GPLA_3539 [Paraglaciecola polaris LMG 21857]